MTVKDINTIIETLCPNDEDYEKPCISPKYLRQELEQLALEQEQMMLEPTTKNDLTVDCISRQAVLNATVKKSSIWNHITNSEGDNLEAIVSKLPSVPPQEPKIVPIAEIKYDENKLKELVNKVVLTVTPQEPTTKKDCNTCTHSNEIDGSNCYECVKDMCNNYDPTTKNDLGVDCISREKALDVIRNLYPSMPRVDFDGNLRKWVDKYKPYIECEDAIEELPSVTPQYSSGLEKNSKKLEKNFGESDCISRQAVLEQAYAYGNGLEPDGYCVNVEDIQALPSVTPQPRKDEVILTNKEYREQIANEYDHGYCKGYAVALEEQEPILDKIYADIQKLRGCSCSCSDGIIDDVEEILDKYKAESEAEDGNE
jgi:hypothetical protein